MILIKDRHLLSDSNQTNIHLGTMILIKDRHEFQYSFSPQSNSGNYDTYKGSTRIVTVTNKSGLELGEL